jgi:SAM-dependent methyltransferase
MHDDGSDRWTRYLDSYHEQHAGITERLLSRTDQSPYGLLATALPGIRPHGLIADIGCGSAPTLPHLQPLLPQRTRWLGVDVAAAELALAAAAGRGPLVRARADALPIADQTVDVVFAAMSLQVLTPADAALSEMTRVLTSNGALIALIPAGGGGPRALLSWGRVFAALRIRTLPWPNPGLISTPAAQLARHGLTVAADRRHTFWLRLTAPGDTDLIIDSLYLPDHTDADLGAARRRLRRLAPRGLRLPLPLRRIVATHAP